MAGAVRILGVDPGLRRMGWGVIDIDGPRLSWVAHGVVTPDTAAELAVRLARLSVEIGTIAETYKPTLAAVEETFVNVNPRSTLLLGQARGAALAALATRGLPVAEYAARKIKQAVVGTGSADKDQIAFMVRRLLPKAGDVSTDAADALAAAVCCANHLGPDMRAKLAAVGG